MADQEFVIDDLAEADCADLLGSHHFGRIGVVSDGEPLIFPVNYLYRDGRAAIRTDPGTKLAAAAMGNVALEIDEIDEASRTGWSVLVKGVGYDVTESIDQESAEMRRFPVDTWASGAKASWIRIEPRSVTGRRVSPA